MSTAKEGTVKERPVSVRPFSIEANNPCNGDIVLASLADVRLRSRIKPVRKMSVLDRRTGEAKSVFRDAGIIPELPVNLPGMVLSVDPAELKWAVVDPLYRDEKTLAEIKAALVARNWLPRDGEVVGVPPKSGTVTADQMKNLVREMVGLVQSEDAVVVKGALPSMADVEGLPGEYLTDPTGTYQYQMPRYEKDQSEWVARLNSMR
jgi:hypothetical protein